MAAFLIIDSKCNTGTVKGSALIIPSNMSKEMFDPSRHQCSSDYLQSVLNALLS